MRKGHDKMSNTKDCMQNMGITIDFLENQNNEKMKQGVPQLWIVLLLNAIGIVLTLTSAFRLPYNMMIVMGFVVLCTLACTMIFVFVRRKKITFLSMVVLFGLIGFYFKSILLKGLNQTIGWVGEVIAECSDKTVTWPVNAVTTYEAIPMTIFFIAVVLPIILLLSYAVIHRVNLFLVLLIVVPIIETTLFFECLPSIIAFVLIILGCFSLFILNQSANKPSKRCCDVRNDILLKKQSENLSLVITSIVGMVMIISWLLVSEADYAHFTDNDSMRNQAGDTIKKTMSFAYEVKTPPQGGITGGDFSVTDEFSFNGETVLEVEADALRGSIYLKGYVGGDYTENGWQSIPKELEKKGAKLSEELQSGNLPAEIIQYDSAMLSRLFHAKERLLKITKMGELLMPYQCIPYYLSESSSHEFQVNEQGVISNNEGKEDTYAVSYFDILNYDNNLFLLNREKIREQLYGNLGHSNGNVTPDELEQFFNKEEAYAEFVKEAYTRLPDNLSQRMVEEFADIDKTLSIESIIKTVMGNLSDRAAYTLTPGKTPGGKDYVDYFLYENKKGYCTHFASAATLIFRMCDIPARYVEGYVITIEDYTRALWTEDGRYVMDIKDTNSHAWCEIYLDGFGWVPVEVTPGLVAVNTGGTAPAGGESIEYETDEENELNDIVMETPHIEYTQNDDVSSDHSGEKTKNTGLNKAVYIKIVIIISILVLLALCILPFILRKRAVNQRIKALRNNNRSQSSVSWYTYIIDALKIAAPECLENRGISDINWAKQMEKQAQIPFETFSCMMPIIQKSVYSQEEISSKEHQLLVKFLENAVHQLYADLPIFKKFKWRFINRLPIYSEIVMGGKIH